MSRELSSAAPPLARSRIGILSSLAASSQLASSLVFKKNFWEPLDKLNNLCYNKDTKERKKEVKQNEINSLFSYRKSNR